MTAAHFEPYRVIGIDPSLTSVGLAVVECHGQGDYQVTVHQTLRTSPDKKNPGGDMLRRLALIQDGVGGFLRDYFQDGPGSVNRAVAIEDPTGQRIARTKGTNNPATIARMGLAVGVALGVVLRGYYMAWPVAFVDVQDWMPNTKSGNYRHILRHDQVLQFLERVIQFPSGISEHAMMAAGVARYWIESHRLAGQRQAAGVKV